METTEDWGLEICQSREGEEKSGEARYEVWESDGKAGDTGEGNNDGRERGDEEVGNHGRGTTGTEGRKLEDDGNRSRKHAEEGTGNAGRTPHLGGKQDRKETEVTYNYNRFSTVL